LVIGRYNSGLDRTWPVRESARFGKRRHQARALWRLMLGRQETEGVLGKSRKAGLSGLGVSSSAKEHEKCSSDGWPFRMSDIQYRPIEVGVRFLR